MMDSAFKMLDFVLKMKNYVFKWPSDEADGGTAGREGLQLK